MTFPSLAARNRCQAFAREFHPWRSRWRTRGLEGSLAPFTCLIFASVAAYPSPLVYFGTSLVDACDCGACGGGGACVVVDDSSSSSLGDDSSVAVSEAPFNFIVRSIISFSS